MGKIDFASKRAQYELPKRQLKAAGPSI